MSDDTPDIENSEEPVIGGTPKQHPADEASMPSIRKAIKDLKIERGEDWDGETIESFRRMPVKLQYQVVETDEDDDVEYRHPTKGYSICGRPAHGQEYGPCLKEAGFGTDYDRGACKFHGGRVPMKHGRYSKVANEKISKLIETYEQDPAPLDITAELASMRAVLVDYINNYHAIREAVVEWNAAEFEEKGNQARPRRLPELSTAFEYFEKVARVAQKQQRLEQEDAISRRQLRRVLSQMARVVEQEISDPDLLRAIKDGWNQIHF
jgi:hypothetical protein